MNVRGLEALACSAFAVLSGCDGPGDSGPGAQAPGVITGTVLYRERIALPPDAQVEVRLEDVTRADAPADVIAEETVAADGRQVPIPFELRYAPARIQANHRYAVRASIRGPSGELMFTTTTRHAVLERDAADQNIAILLQRAAAGASQPGAAGAAAAAGGAAGGAGEAIIQADTDGAATDSVLGGTWRLVAIRRPGAAEEAVGPDPRYTVAFADGRLAGLAHCNRYTGGYEQPEPGKLKVTPMATTLMACPGESIEGEFLRAVGSATSYEVRGERLLLAYGEGGVLIFARDEPAAALARPPAGALAALTPR